MSELTVARTPDEVEALREAWSSLPHPHLTSDIDHFLTFVRHAPAVLRPHVVLLEREGRPAGLVAARLENLRLATPLGYTTLAGPRIRALTVGYGGVLGSLDPGELSTLRDAIVGSLRAERAHVARFRMLERGSSLHEAASTAPFLRRQHLSRPTVHWRTNVDRTADEFFAQLSKERRRAVRRYSRRLEERHGGELEIRVFHAPGDLERVLEDSGRVHRASYQHGLGVGFSEGELHRRLLELSLERGRFRGYVLYLAGEPVAFWHGESYGGVFATSATGFDARRAEDRPGTYLLMRLVRDLCADPSVQILDFGFGDADYKRSFGDVCREEEDVLVFAPGVRAVTANLARTAFEATSRAAHAALARGDALARVRRRWRGRLAPRTVLP